MFGKKEAKFRTMDTADQAVLLYALNYTLAHDGFPSQSKRARKLVKKLSEKTYLATTNTSPYDADYQPRPSESAAA